MKVNSNSTQKIQTQTQSKKDIEAKLKEKFGFVAGKKKQKSAENIDKVQLSKKIKSVKTDGEKTQLKKGQKLALDDDTTEEKLKSVLRTGAFQFSDKERKALSQILDIS